jgi:ribosomal protein L25 (general stress protein Ctc)
MPQFRRAIMAERKEIIIRATAREGRGKNDARRARRNGQVPVTIYGGAQKPSPRWRL